jgi:exodeoxyribonuclease III
MGRLTAPDVLIHDRDVVHESSRDPLADLCEQPCPHHAAMPDLVHRRRGAELRPSGWVSVDGVHSRNASPSARRRPGRNSPHSPQRPPALAVDTDTGPVEIVGVYVPSRDATPIKTERKRRFLHAWGGALPPGEDTRRVVIGDLNLLEPDHHPRYRIFQTFEYDLYRRLANGTAGYQDAFRLLPPTLVEYSWVGRTGDGCRYDHAFVSRPLVGDLTGCHYLHHPRTTLKLSDHSALSLTLETVRVHPVPMGDAAIGAVPDTLW